MKRFVAVLAGLIALPAFAEVAPVFYEDSIEYIEEDVDPVAEVAEQKDVAPVAKPVTRSSRINPRTATASRVSTRATTTARAASRSGVVSRSARPGVVTRSGTLPTVTTRPSRGARTSSADKITTTRRAMQNGGANVARAGITTADTVNAPIYSGNVAARAGMRASSGVGGAVRARIPTVSASVTNSTSATTATTASSAASVVSSMDELAQVTSFCKAQYTECMDNYCNVLDDNQGRCSCSKNIKNYEKTENALKQATEALQDVAQQIQYIGLTGDEIETLFTQTEAEIKMQEKGKDSTALVNSLNAIRKSIVDVKPGTSSASSEKSALNFDFSGLLGFNFGDSTVDLTGIFGNTTANTDSVSNKRGEDLYNDAASKCKVAVLNDCAAQGVNIAVVSNSYDLEIDKQCIAYERALTDANDEMNQTVRNAKSVLQRARLMVAQQKNAYDLRGCVNALDSCMQDDFVCGNDYENCLDPTGKYIVDGAVVIGSAPGQVITNDTVDDEGNVVQGNPGVDASGNLTGLKPGTMYVTDGLYKTWNYDNANNAWLDDGGLNAYITKKVTAEPQTKTSDDMAEYLLYKIGYNDSQTNKNYGMCISILNKCQDYSYESGKYKPDNRVVKEYLMRTMIQIKAAQDEILSDYAESCISDVQSCLGENQYDVTSSNTAKNNIAINACRSQIKTCMSVNGNAAADPNPKGMSTWVERLYETTGTTGQ